MADYSADFESFGDAIYLDCAHQGPMPKVALQAIKDTLELKAHPERIRDALYFELPHQVREGVATLIGATPEEIAIADGASHGINLSAQAFPLDSGDEVLIPDGEFPSGVYPWLAREKEGILVRFLKTQNRQASAEELIEAVREETKVIVVSWISFSDGYRQDIPLLGKFCRENDLFLVVDASQGIGAWPMTAAEWQADIIACCAYKWLLGPYGTSFTYVRKELIDSLRPPNINWYSIETAEDFNSLLNYRLAFRQGACRFDVNEPANFLNVSGMLASMRYIDQISISAIHRHLEELSAVLTESIKDEYHIESSLLPQNRSSIISLAAHAPEETAHIHARLREDNILTSLRENAIRISPGIYNTREEIERLVESLRRAHSSA